MSNYATVSMYDVCLGTLDLYMYKQEKLNFASSYRKPKKKLFREHSALYITRATQLSERLDGQTSEVGCTYSTYQCCIVLYCDVFLSCAG